ncbi:MAG: family 78 glycoside hydrolase catalytic domain [Terracidiphilus sp.]
MSIVSSDLHVALEVHRAFKRRAFILALFALCAATAIAGGASASSPASHLLRLSGLRCDGMTNPLAVDESEPLFSWRLSAASPALHGVSQTAYEIEVAAAGRGFRSAQAILWDSGVVHSSATFGVAYAGPALKARNAYTWRVRVWDERGLPTKWSAIAQWIEAPVWRAHWIAAHATSAAADDEPLPLFRKTFSVGMPVARAILYASGLGQDELHLNGRKIGDRVLTPGWSDYRKTIYYDSYDVTALLRQGQNALGVMLGNGMYRVLHTPGRYTKFVGSFGPPQCIVQLDIDFAGGGAMEIDSDGTWKTLPGPITFSSTYGGEDYDARREPQRWDRIGFNDAGWSAVVVTDGSGGALTPEIAPSIRVMHVYAPVKITHPKPRVTVYDFGQNFAGWPAISVAGRAGAVVKLIPGELLDKNGFVTQRSSGRPQWFSYTLRGAGVESWHPRFSYYGFRYVQVEGVSAQNGVRLLSIRGDAIHSSSAQVGSFVSSDRLLNRIHMLILHAIENNSMSIFTDCPHREKLGWLEETHLMAPSMLYDFDFAGLYAATARNIADAQKAAGPKAGMVPEIAPQYVVFPEKYGAFNDSPEWGSAAVLAPWYVYQRTGDRRFLAAQSDVMSRYVAYLATRAHGGIIDYGLGDWYDIGPGPPGLSQLTSPGVTATAIYYQDLKTMEKVAALLGLTAESSGYRQQAAEVRSAFNARFFDAALGRYDKGSQTAQAMPLVLGIVPADRRAAVLDALVADIRAHRNHTTAGDIGYHYVVDALIENGRSDVLFDMLERTDAPSYGYQLARGATSLTEAWDANPHSSQDHLMLGDAEEWFYRGLGGIGVDLARKGADRIVLHPAALDRIAWVRTHYLSALGHIESDWRHGGGTTVYNFVIPVNAMATIELNTSSPRTMTINGVQPSRVPGAISAQIHGDEVRIVVNSGRYEIRAANPPRDQP